MMVGHIIAQSNGGADHPDNYLPLGREINISMQDTSDQFMCFLAGRKRAKRAMQISSELGNMSFKAGNGKDRYPGQKYFKVSTLDGEDADIYFGTGETCCAPAIKKLKSHNQRKRQQYEREQKDDSDDSD